MIKDSRKEKVTGGILSVIDNFNVLAIKLDQLQSKGNSAMYNNGKLPFHIQKELLLGLSEMRIKILELTKELLDVADMEHKVGEDIVKLISVVSLNRQFLIEKQMLDEFKAFAERETGTPIGKSGILQKLKFWRRG